MLYREPKLLKGGTFVEIPRSAAVSVLYREPKLLKDYDRGIVSDND